MCLHPGPVLQFSFSWTFKCRPVYSSLKTFWSPLYLLMVPGSSNHDFWSIVSSKITDEISRHISRHFECPWCATRMRNPQVYLSGKRPIHWGLNKRVVGLKKHFLERNYMYVDKVFRDVHFVVLKRARETFGKTCLKSLCEHHFVEQEHIVIS